MPRYGSYCTDSFLDLVKEHRPTIMAKPDIVVRAARTIGGPSVYHAIRGNVAWTTHLNHEQHLCDTFAQRLSTLRPYPRHGPHGGAWGEATPAYTWSRSNTRKPTFSVT